MSLAIRLQPDAANTWADLLHAISLARRLFAEMGEAEQAEALACDLRHLAQRAKRHLRSRSNDR